MNRVFAVAVLRDTQGARELSIYRDLYVGKDHPPKGERARDNICFLNRMCTASYRDTRSSGHLFLNAFNQRYLQYRKASYSHSQETTVSQSKGVNFKVSFIPNQKFAFSQN